MLSAVFEPNGYFPSLYALPVFVTAALVLAFGVAVLFREHWSLESRLFFLNVLSVAIWLFSFSAMYCAKSDSAAFFWSKAAYLGVPFIPSCFYHFCVVVLKLGQEKMRLVRVSWLLSVFFAVTIIGTNALISSLYHYSWGYYPRYGWLSPIYLTFFFGMMIVTLRQYWLKMRQTDAATVFGRRARAFLAAFGIVYLGSVDYLPKFGIPIYPFGYIPVFVFLVLAGTAIWKYRLIDITPAFASERILETMHDALIVCDVKGTIRIANQAASRMFDYGPDELIGRSVESLAGIHAASREEVRTLLKINNTKTNKTKKKV
jgi:PAS domain-containing protein